MRPHVAPRISPDGGGAVRLLTNLARPRSVRGRLVATYTVIAVMLAVGGMAVFTILLRAGVTASLDTTLEARTAPVVSAVAVAGPVRLPVIPGPGSTSVDGTDGAPTRTGNATFDAFTAVYRPDGRTADLQPSEVRTSSLPAATVEAARHGVLRISTQVGDERLRVVLIPVHRPDGNWVVAAGVNTGPATAASDEAIGQLEVAVPFLILLAALSAWFLSGAALRPVEAMRADAANLGERDPASRLTVPATADELAKLASTFNGLLDRLHQSLARQRDLIADAGHELRTPLAVLRTELELADGPGRTREDLVDSVSHARGEVERLSALADNLLFLARADSATPIVQLRPLDLADSAAEAVRGHRARAETLQVRLEVAASSPVMARADGPALRRALDNLIANALAATPMGGTVRVEAVRSDAGAAVSVTDTGPGFPEDFLPRAFERFRRPDAARTSAVGGAGLGLAIVSEIAKAHHGRVTVANRPEGGASVIMTLPALTMPGARSGGTVGVTA